jgi:hypothetical protein
MIVANCRLASASDSRLGVPRLRGYGMRRAFARMLSVHTLQQILLGSLSSKVETGEANTSERDGK